MTFIAQNIYVIFEIQHNSWVTIVLSNPLLMVVISTPYYLIMNIYSVLLETEKLFKFVLTVSAYTESEAVSMAKKLSRGCKLIAITINKEKQVIYF